LILFLRWKDFLCGCWYVWSANIEIGCDLMIDEKTTFFSGICFLVQWWMNIHFFHYHHKFFHLYFLYTSLNPIFSPIVITIKISFTTKTYDRSNWTFTNPSAYFSWKCFNNKIHQLSSIATWKRRVFSKKSNR